MDRYTHPVIRHTRTYVGMVVFVSAVRQGINDNRHGAAGNLPNKQSKVTRRLRNMGKLYAISFGYNENEITSHCWGNGCGMGCAGGMDISGGSFIPCRTDKENCPIFEDEKELGPEGDDLIIVRKLRKETGKSAE